jgi:hypothetical protein
MKIVNLTPHALHVRRVDGTDITIEPSGIVPRLEVSREQCEPVTCEDGVEIAVSRATFGALTGMPDPARTLRCGHTTTHGQFVPVGGDEFGFNNDLACPTCGSDYRDGEEVVYVVSALCAQSPELAVRRDVFAPGEALRDASGKIIGATGLSLINPLAGAR